jgi:hypothetical protein
MKAIHWVIAAAALASVQPAQAATTDPEVIIYRFPGVLGKAATVGTVFHCTNFSGVTETLRFVLREFNTTIISNMTFDIQHLGTATVSTHDVNAYTEDLVVAAASNLHHGTMAIAATSINIICTAMTIDASSAAPVGVALRGIRFSPVPGSQE